MRYAYQTFKSPVGTLYLVADGEELCAILFENTWPRWEKRFGGVEERGVGVLKAAQRQLEEYFAGRRKTFDLPLKLQGTDFQKRVWSALAKIEFGRTATYKQQALAVALPKAVRAVGRTNGLNPICIVLPCHRVVGSDGSLTGYAGGLNVKKFLLELEQAVS